MTARWVELADGVLVRRYAELNLSVGLVIGDHGAVVVDTRSDPDQGAELRGAIRHITPLPCTVVLTHAHFDHCLGTAAFLPATVWAHPRCRDDLARVARRSTPRRWPGPAPCGCHTTQCWCVR